MEGKDEGKGWLVAGRVSPFRGPEVAEAINDGNVAVTNFNVPLSVVDITN